ncbi:hypothetical protein SAMD00019534_019100 [Acytostelium subglobosum LB1]|uniref:hypothetical protein n=1 Tax=Acytostelium subglobosum LB1 TaxID=1410327 RepID=UPI000644F476|nr:hypothetical protein SAMD00019534_019100 [Acytostelium subglobosum LB1]GAM18735.1 hypothetical protein SAMD00019534_019100 [Acytostelium subglobosum LB1]|eukprot:XP_012757955.1 hypothetical protein SAMD00019534_019100 [Acytostelium subglobosum LB1]
MTRAKPFSGKQKKDQLKLKKERKRIESSIEADDLDGKLSLTDKRRMAREIMSSDKQSSQQQGQIRAHANSRVGVSRSHHRRGPHRHGTNASSRVVDEQSDSDSDNIKESDSDMDSDDDNNIESDSDNDNDNESVGDHQHNVKQLEHELRKQDNHRDTGRRLNLLTIFEKESKEEIEARKELGSKPIDVSMRDTPWSIMDEHVGETGYIDIPKRPRWSFEMTAEQVRQHERQMFSKWLDGIMTKYPRDRLNYFEHNLEVWRQLWRVSERSDLVLLITDARYPLFHFPPALYNYLTNDLKKPILLVLNKVDLVDPRIVEAWKQYFTTKYPHIKVICFSSFRALRDTASADDDLDESHSNERLRKMKKGRKRYENAEGRRQLINTINSYGIQKTGLVVDNNVHSTTSTSSEELDSEDSSDDNSDIETMDEPIVEAEEEVGDQIPDKYKPDAPADNIITVGMVGHPNVGKSSLINGLMGRKVVSTSRTPGHTKHFQTIFLSPGIQLCDCPGLVFPALDRPKPLQILCGLFPIAQVREPFSAVRYLAERVPVERVYKLQHPDKVDAPWSPMALCEAFALKRGYLLAKTGRADVHRAGLEILRDCVDGNVVISWPPPGFTKDEFNEMMQQKRLSEMTSSTTMSTSTMDNADEDDQDDEDEEQYQQQHQQTKKKPHSRRMDKKKDVVVKEKEVPTSTMTKGKGKGKISERALEYQERLREKQMKGGNKRQEL